MERRSSDNRELGETEHDERTAEMIGERQIEPRGQWDTTIVP